MENQVFVIAALMVLALMFLMMMFAKLFQIGRASCRERV